MEGSRMGFMKVFDNVEDVVNYHREIIPIRERHKDTVPNHACIFSMHFEGVEYCTANTTDVSDSVPIRPGFAGLNLEIAS